MHIPEKNPIKLKSVLLFGTAIGVLSILISSIGLFTFARLRLGDSFFVTNPVSENIVIIALDDDTLNRYGRIPSDWSRDIYTELVTNLIPTNPRVVVFDLLFSNEEAADEDFATVLDQLRQNEARTRIVFATAGVNPVSGSVLNRRRDASLQYQGQIPVSPVLAPSVDYLGYTNAIPDVDNVIRRQPASVQVDDDTGYSLSIATYLAFLRIPSAAADQVIMREEQALYVTRERAIPVDELGFWRPYYFGEPANDEFSTFPIISLVDIIEQRANLAMFEDKIVLIGLINNIDLLDQYIVPSASDGTLMAGVEIHAHAVESIIQNQYVRSGDRVWQSLALFLTSIVASLVFAYVRWHYKILAYLMLMLAYFLVISVIFTYTYILFDLLDFILSITVIFIIMLGFEINLERRLRKQAGQLLDSVQKIAAQQLNLEKAVIYILDDIRKIIPQTNVRLYLNNQLEDGRFYVFARSNPFHLNQLNWISSGSQDTIESLWSAERTTSFHLFWRTQEYGKLVIQKPLESSSKVANQIQNLMDQLAPHVANLLQHDAITQQKSLFNAVINESPAAVAVCDGDGWIIQQNNRLMDFLESPSSMMQSKSILRLLETNTEDEAAWQNVRTGFENGMPVHLEEVRLKSHTVSLSATPIVGYNVWVIILHDISGIVELSDLKTHLMRLAAHDLKNPLSRIVLLSGILKRKLDPTDEQRKYLDSILQSSNEMTSIINDILNVERLRSKQVEFVSIDLVPLVQDVYNSYLDMAERKKQTLKIQVPSHPVFARVDSSLIFHAVSNLVGNAIKYTPEDGHILLRLVELENAVQFEVEDNGYGIAKNAQEKLFAQFYRVQSATTAHIEGTGLGLYLVKNVIEAHGGTVGFESEEAVGSTFYFALPKPHPDCEEHD